MEGRERLRLLSRVMWPSTLSLLQSVGIAPGMRCLDLGCGGGDVAFELARMVGPAGSVTAVDMDQIKIAAAEREALALGLTSIEFRVINVNESDLDAGFDLAHARFLLSHLEDPGRALAKMRDALRPGGMLAVADIDFAGHICDPECAAFQRYVQLYTETVKCRGGDANIGRRLPKLLIEAGFEGVQMKVAQPAGMEGDVKLIAPLTMELIGDAAISAGLATSEEIAQLVTALYEFAALPRTMMSAAPIIQAWGMRPKAVS